MTCEICNHNQTEIVYNPFKSKIDLNIQICKKCGHLFASFDQSKFDQHNNKKCSGKLSFLSCEADYSEIRVGKQQMANYFFNAYEHLNNKPKIQSVLDTKSARGDFAMKALDYFNLSCIDCIEEDDYMTTSYVTNKSVHISNKKYHESFNDKQYDLVYSCHSLEHYRHPKKVIEYFSERVKDQGLLYIDVPNINVINEQNNLDDFFYDKHLHYFQANTLIYLVEMNGFELIYDNTNGTNIGLLFQKKSKNHNYILPDLYQFNTNLVQTYITNLNKNRNRLRLSVDKLNNYFDKNKTNTIVGCGRVLDAFINYANLDLNKFSFFVDDYLIKATDQIYGRDLITINDLPKSDNVLLLVKKPSSTLLEKLQDVKNIYSINEFIE